MQINNNLQLPIQNYNSKFLKPSAKQPSFGALQALGNKITKSKSLQKLGQMFEFEGRSMPFISLATVCVGGVIIPRLIQARDKDEFREILIRDCTTVGIMLFARKALQNAASKVCSKFSGLPLLKYPQNHVGVFKQIFNHLRPDKGVSILTSQDIASKYTNIDKFENGIVDFCDFVSKSGGDVKKVFNSNTKLSKAAKKAFDAANMGVDFEVASSSQISEAFLNLHNCKSEALNDIYAFFKNGKNELMSKARTLNSSFDFLATFVLVPTMLGYALPNLMETKLKDKYINKTPQANEKGSDINLAKNEKTLQNAEKTYFNAMKKRAATQISTFKEFV